MDYDEEDYEKASTRQILDSANRHPELSDKEVIRLIEVIKDAREAATELEQAGASIATARKRNLRKLVKDGKDAELTLVQAHSRLVVSIAQQHETPRLSFRDLYQEGLVGLTHALRTFDVKPDRGFRRHAETMIRERILAAIEVTGRPIRVPLRELSKVALINQAHDRLRRELQRPVTEGDLADATGLAEDEVHALLRLARVAVSISQPVSAQDDTELGEIMTEDWLEDRFDDSPSPLDPHDFKRLLTPLDDREREVITLLFGLDGGSPRTLEQVGQHFGLTGERIRQIREKAFLKLRPPGSDTGGRDLLAT